MAGTSDIRMEPRGSKPCRCCPFVNGEEITTYRNMDELQIQIENCLENPSRMIEIGASPAHNTLSSQTYKHKIRTIPEAAIA
jgi:hypothetical protein